MRKPTLAILVGNRDFFPDRLVSEGRADLLALCTELGIEPVILSEADTKLGAVETWQHARRCADLFSARRADIDGVLVSLPNFGDEKGVADALQLAALNVPVLVQAYPDSLDQLNVERRRDAFCGKISVCNNLRQYGIPFSLTTKHTVHPHSDSFKSDLRKFLAVCRVARSLKSARLGAIGARPNAFNTTRYSEKLLQASGLSVNTIDLSEIFGQAQKIGDQDARVRAKLEAIGAYSNTLGVPDIALLRMAKLALAISDWMGSLDLDATAFQCWTSIQQNYGINPCTVMSMMSEQLLPSACEVDITGVVSMYALQLASQTPSALVDWNNNYGDDDDRCVLFHCGNWAKSFLPGATVGNAPILGSTLGLENTYGTLNGRTPAGPLTFARVTTDDPNGRIRAYCGQGSFTDDPLETFGSRAVVHVPRLQKLLHHICRQGFEHHAAMSASHCSAALSEALETYLGWEVYHHEA